MSIQHRSIVTLVGIFGTFAFLALFVRTAAAAEHVTTPCMVASSSTCTLYSVISASKDDEITWKIYELNGALRATIKPYPGLTGGMVIAEGDIDGDGVVEWITAPEGGRAESIRVWSPLGGFESGVAYSPSHPSLTVGNFDDDDADELAVTSRTRRNSIQVFDHIFYGEIHTYDLTRTLTPTTVGALKGLEIAAGDIDGDGLDDIVSVSANGKGPQSGNGALTVFGRNSDGIWGEIAARQVGEGYRLRVGNIRGDGADEIVIAQRGPGTPQHIFLYQWDGTDEDKLVQLDSFAARVKPWSFISLNGTDIELADLTGNEYKEIVTFPNQYVRAPVVVWQYGGVVRAIGQINTFGPQVNGINVIARNAAPDKDTRYHSHHDELLVAPKGGSRPTVKLFRFIPQSRIGLELVRSFVPFHPFYRGEVRLNSPTD